LTAEKINETKNAKGRIIAVGTTTVRTLESAASQNTTANETLPIGTKPTVLPFMGSTALYIMPGYQFKVVDALITNFHVSSQKLAVTA
jgi:S-adenosylmethionine:tRNA ribosyltransferase-isomerase